MGIKATFDLNHASASSVSMPQEDEIGEDEQDDSRNSESHATLQAAATPTIIEPRTVKEALAAPDAEQWRLAMSDEYGSLLANGTWELVDLPPGRHTVGSKWVLKLKRNPDGSIERYKARLVAKGFSQRYGEDFHETYSPVASLPTIRVLLCLALQKGWYVDQFDVKTAYLNGILPSEETVYMTQPDGYVVPGQETKVCKLIKSLYGLKQAGRRWYIRFAEVVREQGMQRCRSDACVFFIKDATGAIGIIIVYVDDVAAISSNRKMRARLKAVLTKKFEIHSLGPILYILGIKFHQRDNGAMEMSQSH